MAGTTISLKWEGFKEFETLLDEIKDDFSEKDSKKILQNACLLYTSDAADE